MIAYGVDRRRGGKIFEIWSYECIFKAYFYHFLGELLTAIRSWRGMRHTLHKGNNAFVVDYVNNWIDYCLVPVFF